MWRGRRWKRVRFVEHATTDSFLLIAQEHVPLLLRYALAGTHSYRVCDKTLISMSPPLWLLLLAHSALAALPQVDFTRMGKVGLAGSFAGLDLFSNDSLAFDPTTSTLLARDNDGALTRLASTNQGGKILAGCALGDAFYLAGDFSSIAGTQAANVASYDPSSGAFAALGSNGPNAAVHAVFCDADDDKLWVGGTFSSPGKAVAVWDAKANSWSAAPFAGLSGDVLSITTNASAASLFFSGDFLTSFDGNTTVINGTNNPNVPFSAGATPFSSSLVPIPLQNAELLGSPSSSQSGFSDIENVLCPAGPDGPGNSWFAADGNEAVVTARAFSFISASGVRIGNTFQDGRGTTAFRCVLPCPLSYPAHSPSASPPSPTTPSRPSST